MKNFREFKENIVSSIQKKIAEKLESKKIEMARKMFGEGIEITESPEDAKKSKEKQSLIDKWVKKGKNRAEATKKVESLYDYVKRVYPDAPPAKMIEIMWTVDEDVKESTDISEGMEAFKAAAEVLKVFGGKKPSKTSDLMKFDSELEKVSKKYDVSVDDILKVINK